MWGFWGAAGGDFGVGATGGNFGLGCVEGGDFGLGCVEGGDLVFQGFIGNFGFRGSCRVDII